MFPLLNAAGYNGNSNFFHAEFERVLSYIIVGYKQMLLDAVTLTNEENSIRDVLLYSYLKRAAFKKKNDINDFLFDKELEENTGRIDIRVMPVNPFVSDDAYYIIECKRLNSKNTTGKTGLNGEYIVEGVCRFVSQKYSCYHQTNGMIGFVVDKLDIEKNIISLNTLLSSQFPEAKTLKSISKRSIVNGFDFSYYSTHTGNIRELLLYHLMLNFSDNISN
ncbi:MAG: hypothetical protein JST58_02870 [Bacteroidetes bacterium]|nr:hypothetical protein [Bacteroidota bacterium]